TRWLSPLTGIATRSPNLSKRCRTAGSRSRQEGQRCASIILLMRCLPPRATGEKSALLRLVYLDVVFEGSAPHSRRLAAHAIGDKGTTLAQGTRRAGGGIDSRLVLDL